ncbi:hypothetical protein SASPL_157337 [Salvia splendens]|uniref:Alpha-carbonic anhydrase domain-containing protein n=1 Tax=Salvia splendens TaxID=180675 RepID=A0A8X8VV91_SALSN|nr:hypothetical protein SASPL_157337 [Salvia splendens]
MGSIRSSSVHRFTTCLIGFSLLMAIHSENRDGEVDNEHEFSYLKNSSKGTEHWGSLKEEWKLCSIGNFQSPINIIKKRVMVSSQIGKLRRNYRPALAVLRNTGHDIMIVRTFIIGTTWNCYMVHRSSEGQFVVIAILYHLGRSDHFLDKVSGKGYNRHLAIM